MSATDARIQKLTRRSWWSRSSPCSRLDGMLPGVLVGARVVMSGSLGTIIVTGHQYGPGGGHDQALIRFDSCLHPGDSEAEHPLKRRDKWCDEESWHYLESLEFAPEND